MTIRITRGSTAHGLFCDAFLDHAGYVAINGELYELLSVDVDEHRENAFVWKARRVCYAGRA
jgi:hypothetical protein